MQILKAFLFVCPALLCVAPLALNAADTPEQIKAREALEKFNQPQPVAAAPAVAPAPAPEPPKAAEPAPEPKPVQPAPAKAPEPAPVAAQSYPVLVMPTPADQAALEKAREALRQKMNELNTGGQPAVAPVTTAPAPAPAPVAPAPAPAPATAPVAPASAVVAASAAAPTVIQTPGGPTLVLPPSADPAAIEKAREAMRQQLGQVPQQPVAGAAQPPGGTKTHVATATPAPKPASAPKGMPVFEPLQGPPSSVPAEKQVLLAALLQKYLADQITPDQYHAERAKILAK